MSDAPRCEGSGKRVFFTDHEAREALIAAKATKRYRKGKGAKECRHYRCDYCGYYHLTSHDQYHEPKVTTLKPYLKFFKHFKKYM